MMKSIEKTLGELVRTAVQEHFGVDLDHFEFQATRKDFEGDITLVTFSMLRQVKTKPAELGKVIGDYLVEHSPLVSGFNVVQGFLNIVINDCFYLDLLSGIEEDENYGKCGQTE